MTALIVVGPRKLPESARNIGEARGEFKETTGEAESIDV
jgi:Sec-independent protein translocase protein TatA